MENWTSIARGIWLGKTISPRSSTKQNFLKSGGYFEECNAGEFFTIKGNPQLDKENFAFSKDSQYPYFTRTVFNNGIYGYVDYLDDVHLIKGNSLAVGMMGMKFFYMPHDFYAGQFTKTAFPKFKGFNSHIAIWFISWFNKYSEKYSNLLVRDFEKTFLDTKIMVPRHSNGELALDYIEVRIREMEQILFREMDTYLKYTGFEDCELTEEEKKVVDNNQLSNKNIVKRSLGSLFDIHPTNAYKLTNSGLFSIGNHPVVTNTSQNNGIGGFSALGTTENGGMITFSDTTTSDAIFYQPNDFIGYPHVQGLYAKDQSVWSEESLLYVVTAFRKCASGRFDYATKFTRVIASKMELVFPATSTGEIDYHFMELYIRAQEKLAIQRVKDWRAREIETTKDIVEEESKNIQEVANNQTETYTLDGNEVPAMIADDVIIYGSLEVRLHNTKREELMKGGLSLILMYAIAPVARDKTESAGKIALGIKEKHLSSEVTKAFESVKYIMFHYWKNNEARPFELTNQTRLVTKENIPEGYLIRQDNEAAQYLLIEYNPAEPSDFGTFDILKTQRKGADRYMPFVCRVDNIM